MAAVLEYLLRLGLLEVAAADLLRWNLGSYGEDGNAVAMAVVKTVDQVGILVAAGEVSGNILKAIVGVDVDEQAQRMLKTSL